jgi:hypothetical protein
VTDAVHRMPMTGAVLRDPLLVAASAQHAQDDITKEKRLADSYGSGDRAIGWSGDHKSKANFDGPMTRW